MKKTISINIAGQIFYIEEDGYDMLRQYLGSVHRYFSSFADSAEIVADIEGRIAERFLQKQKVENKQAISIDDVSELIQAMGNVTDFEAAENADDLISEPLHAAGVSAGQADPAVENGPQRRPQKPKERFYRDLKRKILGGVAAGIAHHYAMDPLWVRLLLLLGIFGMVPISGIMNFHKEEEFAFLGGFLMVAYIAMWVAFPGSAHLEDEAKIRKFYRDPTNKVLGGVASGLASYFNLDTGIVRFLWVISILFFGIGILIYIILWAIAPVANTLTEKMEMQGEAITLSNIDSTIRRNLSEGSERVRESDLKRLLLLPFQIFGKILNALGRVLKGLGPVLRVLIGIFMVGLAISGLLMMLVCGAALLGLANMPDFGVFPPEFLILKETPGVLILSIATIVTVPLLVLLFLGLMLLLNRKVVGSTVWIVMAGLMIFSIVGAISSGLVFQRNFVEEGEFSQVSRYPLGKHVLFIDQDGSYSSKTLDVEVNLKGSYRKDSAGVEKIFHARGATRQEARDLAGKIVYDVERIDSTLYFPGAPFVSETLPFRNQHIYTVLEVPYNTPFAMSRNFYFGFLRRNYDITKNLENMDLWNRELDWKMLRWSIIPDSGLVCLNLPQKFFLKEEAPDNRSAEWDGGDSFDGIDLGERGEFVKQIVVPEFRGIDLGGAYRIQVKKDNQFSVTLDGSEENVELLAPKVENGILRIDRTNGDKNVSDPEGRIGVVIRVPFLESVELSGSTQLKADDFAKRENLRVKLSGASAAELSANADRVELELTGASRMLFKGNVSTLKAGLSGSCLLDARESVINQADIQASGSCRANLGTVQNLEKRENGNSRVTRR